ncbi:hypothetical protein TOPH_01025 [Tolypocladium ophioglossoides CBS 100239]|uniref:S-adenosyl-L-methionine-dependent methyltransferase n=1 Tax=Tolypocladium ophioglossoides (strain CBS 100239) TaxID=1163406 RepID=A0A0L0NKR7_TOLOC|nr:hypothetical protein TOPH_01025 [Tolypocladium ophioglossoides CBS 100239]
MTHQKTIFEFHGHILELDPAFDTYHGESLSVPTKDAVAAPDAVLEKDGRTYQGYKQGILFAQRRDLQHELSVLALDGQLGLAPVKSPKHALDIATGTGIWAIQYAEQNPTCNVIGTDISPIQRKASVPNCSFVQQDTKHDDWGFPQKFDYIHLRFAFDNLAPGGYLEFYDSYFEVIDFDGTIKGTGYERWKMLVKAGAQKVGRDPARPLRYKDWCREVGFVGVREEVLPLPCGPWAKDPKMKKIGLYMQHNLLGLIGVMNKFLELAGASHAEIQELHEQARKDVRDPTIHFGVPMLATYARKPE